MQASCTPPTKHVHHAVDQSDYEDKKQGINVWERSDEENVGTKLEAVSYTHLTLPTSVYV